jgi:hypothetical protein
MFACNGCFACTDAIAGKSERRPPAPTEIAFLLWERGLPAIGCEAVVNQCSHFS